MKHRLFIGSSVEGLEVAYSIQEELEYDSEPTIWKQGIFDPSSFTLTTLIKAVKNTDFAIFVFTPDDISVIRSKKSFVVRDNVVFEFGIFIGGLGKNRVFFVVPRSVKNFHLPTDLTGVTPGTYDDKRRDKNLNAALGPFCNKVRRRIKDFSKQKKKTFGSKKKTSKVQESSVTSALELFKGTWRNDYFNENGQKCHPEFFEIKDGNRYCINGNPFFTVENIKINLKKKKLSFDKVGINDERVLHNELTIVDSKTYDGFESKNIKITYSKVQ